jgi:SSS family solute:Na+ symporter
VLALVAWDWIVMAAYGAVVLFIGWRAHRRQRGSEDYFLGGRRLRWWVVGVSLIATSFSSASLMGGTGHGFARGLDYLQLQIGDLVGIVVVCALFLPFFSRLGLTTAYEYLERRFGVAARTVASLLFLGQTLLRASVLIYVPALALASILDWPVWAAIVVAASAAMVYSAFGGIAAVVWTDLIQFAVIVFAVIYCLVQIAGDVPGGFGALLEHARDHGRLEVVTLEAERGTPFNLLGALVPYAVFATSLFGTGQQAVQRFLSCKDLPSARRAAVLGWSAGLVAVALTLFLGVCLAAWNDYAPETERLVVQKSDEVFPRFIDEQLGPGIAGLVLAAIFAASMSSLDSAIHSMSTAALVDFVRRFGRRPPDPRRELRLARYTTVAFGLVAIVGALFAAEAETQILETLFTWLGYFAGPLLGLFLLGMLTRRANEPGALLGVGIGFGGVVVAVATQGVKPWGFHPLWLAPASCVVTFVLGWLGSLAASPPALERLEGLVVTSSAKGAADRSDP